MKKLTVGLFDSREQAEKAINDLHRSLGIANDDISFVYRNAEGEVKEVDADDVASATPGEGAKTGAGWGAGIGAIAGLATALGAIPVIGPVIAAGPLMAALGLGAGVLGTTAAGAATGAVAGGLIGALVGWGVSEADAQKYEDGVKEGNVLVATSADDTIDVTSAMIRHGARDVSAYAAAV